MKTIEATNFIEDIINKDIEEGKCDHIQMRHPPEPSGYLHIGHVRNIVLNYGTPLKYGGICNLRYDDTNPGKESQEFVDGIQEDVKWLGYEWNEIHYATEYFQQNYEVAVKLIKEGKVFVCDLSPEELSKTRGTLTEPGTDSPFKNRSIEENLDLFERMKNGEFEPGTRCLRAKIDMASPNMNMRDPVIFRIQNLHHQRIGDSWKIYPSYDFSHPLDDALEGVSHSICGPEFEDHRPLYNWVVDNSGVANKPRQIEYANLYIKGAILGKRFIKKLVQDGVVSGFDDPRLYSLCGLRRRGVLPESLKEFVVAAGISKSNSLIDPDFLNYFIRNTLNKVSKRVMAVLNPIKLVINNWDKNVEEEIELEDYPQNEDTSIRKYVFGQELYIEKEDFIETPDKNFYRLYPGAQVRLKGAYIVKCTGFDKDEQGDITCVYCDYLEGTKSGSDCQIKVKGTIHWVNVKHCKKIECRLFENLINEEDAELVEGQEHAVDGYSINPDSIKILKNCYIEDGLTFDFEERYQFMRNAYFCLDEESTPGHLIFNRTIGLKDNKKKT